MKRKTRNILWIFLLALLSFPAGYLLAYVEQPTSIQNEKEIALIAGGIACILVFGTISAIIYIIMRVRKSADPAKAPLMVSSILIGLLIITKSVQLPGAIKTQERHEFLESMRESFTTTFAQKISEMPDAPAELKEHAQEAALCIYYEIKSNEALVDEMMATPDPKNFTATSPEVKKIIGKCFSLYMEPLPH
jgi:hypothetical protein